MASTQRDAHITQATADDVPTVKKMVNSAYSKYIDRIGKPPAPMTCDYYEIIRTSPSFILKSHDDKIMGAIILICDYETKIIHIQNLVVDPAYQGHGYGRVLMNYAEQFALSKGISALELYTNVKMHENIHLYAKLGFLETARRTEEGFERVYFRKELKCE